jgi:3',5'-cyclic AMP phosphodiesterase CpdA
MARIIHLSDIHFGAEIGAAVEGALAYTRASSPDLIVITGDLTLNGLPREFRAAAAWRRKLPDPTLLTPGNHDTPYWNIPLRALQPFGRYRRYLGSPRISAFDGAGLAVRMINTARGAQPRPDWSKGAVSLAAAGGAISALDKQPATVVRIVGCHHPLVEAPGTPVTGGVHRGGAAARLFAEGGIDLVLTGHVHTPFAFPLPFGDGKTYAVGAGTLSKRTRGAPPSFNLIETTPSQLIVTVIAWSGDAFAATDIWRLERRRIDL